VGAFSLQMASIKTLIEPWIIANIEEGVKLVSTPHHRVREENFSALFQGAQVLHVLFIPPMFYRRVSNILSKPTMPAIGTTKGT
jgi:hypothetical protein